PIGERTTIAAVRKKAVSCCLDFPAEWAGPGFPTDRTSDSRPRQDRPPSGFRITHATEFRLSSHRALSRALAWPVTNALRVRRNSDGLPLGRAAGHRTRFRLRAPRLPFEAAPSLQSAPPSRVAAALCDPTFRSQSKAIATLSRMPTAPCIRGA